MEIDENRMVVFRFDNIMLPDSFVNEPASNGFVNYFIQQNSDLANGVVIENSAGIFFDFNPPVLTNTTKHVVDDGLTSTEDLFENQMNLLPNPANDWLNISIGQNEELEGDLEILNTDGRRVFIDSYSDNMFVDTSVFPDGIYIIRVVTKAGKAYQDNLIVTH